MKDWNLKNNIPARRVLKCAIKNYNRTFSKHFKGNNYHEAWGIADKELLEFLMPRGWTVDPTRTSLLYYVQGLLYTEVKNKSLSRLGRAAIKEGKLADLSDLYFKVIFKEDLRKVKFL